MDLVVDKCPDPESDPDLILVSKLPNVENWLKCQYFCDEVFEADCKSLMYQEEEQICFILGNTYEDYIELCDAFGGNSVGEEPHSPSDCLRDNVDYPNRCKFMLQSECVFHGDPFFSSTHIIDPEECSQLSTGLGGDFYYHDATVEECTVYDNRSRDCNIQRSLRGAKDDGCQGEN